MEHVLDVIEEMKRALEGRQIVLFLDYDGTLAPIALTPDKAVMAQEMVDAVTKLSLQSRFHITIISGRSLRDLKGMIQIPNLTYIGNHGFEIEGPTNFNFECLIPTQYLDDLAQIKLLLQEQLVDRPGVWIEDKGTIATVHFRMATQQDETAARAIIMEVCRGFMQNHRIKIMEGKKVLEVRPPIKWDKGEAALWVLTKWQQHWGKDKVATIYVGDDRTDEDAFSVIKNIGLTVYVGSPKESHAQYYLNNIDDVITFLNYLN